MKNIFKIYFIIILLVFGSSCAEVSSLPPNNTFSNNSFPIIPVVKKCSDFADQVACDAEKPRCEYYDENCFNQVELLAKKTQETVILNKIDDEIKKVILSSVLIKNDGTVLENQDLDKISEEDFSKLSHIILPKSNTLIKQLEKNPFADEDIITTVRLILYGKPLTIQKTENGNVVLKVKDSEAVKKVIDEAKLNQLFGDFKKPENLLGKGGQGSVYKVNYAGEDYALKINAQEYEDLEKLQSTGAVVKIFGAFTCENKPCMLMEVGQKSLFHMNKNGEKLTNEQIMAAIENFKKLLDAQKKLNIQNNDIKPENLLLTKDNKLVVIDVSSSNTPGYGGSSKELLARALIENKIGKSFKGGYITLDKFFDYGEKYVDNNIISPENLVQWNQIVCAKILPREPKCKDIKNFTEFFELMPTAKIYEMALEINKECKDLTGTVDQTSYGLYKTGLPMPFVQELKDSDWKGYYEQRDKVINRVCFDLYSKDSADSAMFRRLSLFHDKYQNSCELSGTNKHGLEIYKLKQDFTSAKDDKFKQFIKDAFYVTIYKNTFKKIAEKYSYDKTIQEIIELNLDKTDPVDQSLFDLYKS